MGGLRRLARRLVGDQMGVAMIEFAYAAPVFLAAILTGLELTNLVLAHLRVSQMAMAVADNAGRVPSGIDEVHIREVFAGAQVIGGPMDFQQNGRIVLSSLEDNGRKNSSGGQWIRWQRCWGEGKYDPAYGRQGDGEGNASLKKGLGSSGNRIIAASGTSVMFVEATYKYQPLIATGFFDPPTIHYESAFNVRGRQNNAISNTQSLPVLAC